MNIIIFGATGKTGLEKGYATLLRNSLLDHTSQEKAVCSSNLDWTIIRPSGLTDSIQTGKYLVGEFRRDKTI